MINRLRTFFQDLLVSIGQYPGAYVIAVALAIVGLIMNHDDYPQNQTLFPYLVSLLLTLPLILTGPFMQVIRPSLSNWYRYGGQIGAIIVGLLFYFSLPETLNDPTGSQALRVVFSLVTAWLFPLVSIVIATRGNGMLIRGWSRQFIFSLAVSVVSAMIMWGGISASIASIEYLFNISLSNNGDVYLDIGIIAWSILGTAVRLTRLHDNDEEREYNKLFRFFGLYIFTPLTLVYMLILIAYAVKILVLQERPAGGTVWLVGRFMAFSMIGYLLIYPLIEQTPRLRKAEQGYMVSVILFTIYLIIALIKRFDYHGFTVEEYYIILLASWMLVVGIVTLARKKRSLSVIISLLVFLLGVSIYGPWSATNVSTYFQYNRLTNLLENNNFLTTDGYVITSKVVTTGDAFSSGYQQIYTTASYLGRQEGTGIFQPLYSGTEFDQLAKTNRRNIGDQFMASLGLASMVYTQRPLDDKYRYFNMYSSYEFSPNLVDVAGYSQLVMLSSNNPILSTGSLLVSSERKDKSLILLKKGSTTTSIDLYEYLDTLSGSLYNTTEPSGQPLSFVTDKYILILLDLSGQRPNNNTMGYEITYYRAIILLK